MGAHNTHPDLLAGFKGFYFKEKERKGEGRLEKWGRGRGGRGTEGKGSGRLHHGFWGMDATLHSPNRSGSMDTVPLETGLSASRDVRDQPYYINDTVSDQVSQCVGLDLSS